MLLTGRVGDVCCVRKQRTSCAPLPATVKNPLKKTTKKKDEGSDN